MRSGSRSSATDRQDRPRADFFGGGRVPVWALSVLAASTEEKEAAPSSPSPPSSSSSYHVKMHSQATTASQISLPTYPASDAPTTLQSAVSLAFTEGSSADAKSYAVRNKLSDLRFLTRRLRPEPGLVWACYMELLQHLRYDKLPLEVHQEVLRNCTLPATHQRVASATRFTSRERNRMVHKDEARFKTVIRNIRAAGLTPSLDDYHYILEQFAAVGHHRGVMEVMEEIDRVELRKSSQTYGLCLQALCHRLSLPCAPDLRSELVDEVTKLCMKLQVEMQEKAVPYTSVNADLVLRILKETADLPGFEKLLKGAYGIDLSFPDRPPLELWGQASSAEGQGSSFSDTSRSAQARPPPLPFSSAALTTTVDFLGRLGDVSKLVQAFEVLTTPLPTKSATTSPAYDEDEEDDFGVSNPQVAPWRTPYAVPNTTTYHLLLKHLARAGNAPLARHYLLQAIRYENDVDWQVRLACARKPRSEIVGPHMAVNRSMILAVFGVANRSNDLELMRWTLYKTGQAIRRKRDYIKYYERRLQRWSDADKAAKETSAAASATENATSAPSEDAPASADSSSSAVFSSYFTPSSASEEVADKTVHVPPTPYFNVDVATPAPSSPTPPKPFEIVRHLIILRQDLERLQELEERIADGVGRVGQRIKEKLGRRVWKGKDIYMRDLKRRVVVSKEEWTRKGSNGPPNMGQGRIVLTHDIVLMRCHRKARRRFPE
ncbi:uncharacterized protein C8Q71DRAFT_819638 [Rhodofomes roseus]|uniref:Uncharacterized protein n=1 Tax=Rhodofomes roseus TaxID=34475 RepID=A0ABQ8KYE1_9APHY|nr:uncharacterized protein C8Q71DRAFT_819638 [Rhodofomes roseus]KAH9844043.1 hypothetical protein C8Q71DRAFT_819638 [Rhodofomes roseus]